MQDGASSHTSAGAKKVNDKTFGKNKVMQNPPNYLDLNVLDYHLWDHIDKMVQQSEINTLLDLNREVAT